MVIFTEVMKDMVLQAKGPTEVVITEEQIVIRITEDKIEVRPTKAVKTPKAGKAKRLFTYKGESLSAREWAERYGVPMRLIYQRFAKTGSPETKMRHGREKKTSKK